MAKPQAGRKRRCPIDFQLTANENLPTGAAVRLPVQRQHLLPIDVAQSLGPGADPHRQIRRGNALLIAWVGKREQLDANLWTHPGLSCVSGHQPVRKRADRCRPPLQKQQPQKVSPTGSHVNSAHLVRNRPPFWKQRREFGSLYEVGPVARSMSLSQSPEPAAGSRHSAPGSNRIASTVVGGCSPKLDENTNQNAIPADRFIGPDSTGDGARSHAIPASRPLESPNRSCFGTPIVSSMLRNRFDIGVSAPG